MATQLGLWKGEFLKEFELGSAAQSNMNMILMYNLFHNLFCYAVYYEEEKNAAWKFFKPLPHRSA